MKHQYIIGMLCACLLLTACKAESTSNTTSQSEPVSVSTSQSQSVSTSEPESVSSSETSSSKPDAETQTCKGTVARFSMQQLVVALADGTQKEFAVDADTLYVPDDVIYEGNQVTVTYETIEKQTRVLQVEHESVPEVIVPEEMAYIAGTLENITEDTFVLAPDATATKYYFTYNAQTLVGSLEGKTDGAFTTIGYVGELSQNADAPCRAVLVNG